MPKKNTTKKTPVQIRIDPELLKMIDDARKEKFQSRSAFITQACIQRVFRIQKENPSRYNIINYEPFRAPQSDDN